MITMMTTALALDKTTQIFPSKGIHGFCIDCGEEVISKCGTIVSHHFAHTINSNCGSKYHDNKSEWHQEWQHTVVPAIPGKNVEVTISLNNAIKRADLISNSGYIVEFQHSPLSIPERLDREQHYKKMIWVVHTDRMNSRTWNPNVPSGVLVFFNGDNDNLSYKGISLKKSLFVRWVINSKFFKEESLLITEQRQLKKRNTYGEDSKSPHWFNSVGRNPHEILIFSQILNPRIVAFATIAYWDQQLTEYLKQRAKAKKQRELEVIEEKRSNAKYLSLPAREYAIKIISDFELQCEGTDRDVWIDNINRMIQSNNKERYNTILKIKREREIESAKQTNAEIINNQLKQQDAQIQERIRIDLIRSKGNIEYAAECARKRLAALGIDYNNELIWVAYGVGTE